MNSILKNFVERVDIDTLNLIHDRLDSKMQGDVCEVLEMVESKYKDLDKWLATAKNADDFYNMVDSVRDAVLTELKKRNV